MTNAWPVLIVALSAQFGISMVDAAIPTLAGFLKADFGFTAATAGLIVSAFPFGKILGSYAAGRAADRIGERRVLLIGGLGTSAFALLAAVSPLPLVLLCLIAGGAGASAATPAGGRFILNSFAPDRRGFANGVRQAAVPVAGVVAAVVLPPLASSVTWRLSLAAAAAATIVALIPLAAVRIGDGGDLLLDAASLPGRAANRNVKLLTVWGALLVTGQYAVLAFLALDFHQSAGMTLPTALLLVGVANASGAVCRVGWGALSDRVLAKGRKPLLLSVNASAITGSVLLFVTPRSAPTVILGFVAAVAGIALIGFQGLWVTMVAEAADRARIGAATGFAVTFATSAVTVSPPLFGLVADITGSYRSIWIVLTVLVVAALIPASLVRERTDVALA